jgi:hypothetical protein
MQFHVKNGTISQLHISVQLCIIVQLHAKDSLSFQRRTYMIARLYTIARIEIIKMAKKNLLNKWKRKPNKKMEKKRIWK